MTNQFYTKTNKSSDRSASNTAPFIDTSKFHLFEVQAQKQDKARQLDFKTSFNKTEKYGHHPNQVQPANISSNATPVQRKIEMGSQVIQTFRLPWSKKKKTTSAPVAPAPAKPSPDWNNLANDFKPGDKLYGLAGARPQGAVKNAAAGKANVIDQLNNQFLGTAFIGPMGKDAGEKAKKDPTTPMAKEWKKAASYGEPNKMANAPTNEQQKEAAEYRKWLEKHPKYSPTTTEVRKEPLSSPFRQWDRTKKSSKAGLEYTTKEKQNNVHFMLDGLNQKAVVNKLDHKNMRPEQKINPVTGDSQNSITASELRFLYRKQNDTAIMSNVKFWQGGQQVQAPWKTNPALWANYKPKSWGGKMLPPPVIPDLQKEFNAGLAKKGI